MRNKKAMLKLFFFGTTDYNRKKQGMYAHLQKNIIFFTNI